MIVMLRLKVRNSESDAGYACSDIMDNKPVSRRGTFMRIQVKINSDICFSHC